MQPFVIPSVLPQDLLLIHDLIGNLPTPSKPIPQHEKPTNHSDHDHGTDSDTDSEKEVEADILPVVDEEPTPPSESTSDSDSSSDSDSESEELQADKKPRIRQQLDDDDDDPEPTGNADAQMRTKNELLDVDVPVPDISQVGPHEQLENVGEIMSIVDRVVIVKGLPSPIVNRGSEKALDSDTLLVFEDRKVLGYIFETFGPTSEPLYQIRFNQKHPLDPETVWIGRPVFHVPAKSNYVFVQRLRHLKGSDASNVHDEEPGEDELEFSDDEQEAAHKRAHVGRREQSRARSISRQSTPLPSRMRDQDMFEDPYGGPSYDSLPYSNSTIDAGTSRPPPIPYDDPYSDSYGSAPQQDDPPKSPQSPQSPRHSLGQDREQRPGHNQHSPHRREDHGRGRGRGRGRRHNDRGRGRGRGTGHRPSTTDEWPSTRSPDEYDPRHPRPISPTSLAIARATGQQAGDASVDADMGHGWGYPGPQYPMHPMMMDFPFTYQNAPVQPHINPRFAANFGMAGMGMGYMGYGNSATYGHDQSGNWNENWNPPPG